MDLQADGVSLATELLRVTLRQDASQVSANLVLPTNLLDLPSDLLADVLRRAMPWRCRLVCRAFRTHIDAGRTSVHLTSLTTDASLGSELRALLVRLPGLKQLVACDTINDPINDTINDNKLKRVERTSRNCESSSRPPLGRLRALSRPPLKASDTVNDNQVERSSQNCASSSSGFNFLSACPQLVSLRFEHSAWLKDFSGVTVCNGLESLCVQGCFYNLTSVPALTACSRLTSLSLSGLRVLHGLDVLAEYTQLQSLFVQGLGFCSVPPLAACTQLTSVIWEMSGITNITPLSSCTRLRSLLCRDTNSVDLAPLAACRELTSLALPRCRNITGFATLSAFSNLQRLSLTCGEIPRFARAIEKCTALTWLDVSRLSEGQGSSPTHIYFVTPLVHLVHLNLSGLPCLASITPLTNCHNLQSLELDRCEAIAQLLLMPSISQQLTALRIENFDAEHINVLASFTQLVQLGLDSWGALNDLKALAACKRLASLHVPYCKGLVDALPIASCSLLTSLSFRQSRMLSDISVVTALPLLQQLDIASTDVADITPVGCCLELADLDLSWCKRLPHITPLAACGKLQRLDLRCCSSSITDLSVLPRLPILRSVLVDKDFDTRHLGGRIRFRIGKGCQESH